ncbi:MAG: hypothetical protein U0176_01120 [Bacteroidia bacterium]
MVFRGRMTTWAMLGTCMALILLSVLTMPWWTVDDAFISYRYGQNLLYHGKLTWNPAEPELVEGYTGILLPLLTALILKIGLPVTHTVKVIGLLSALGTVAWLRRGLQGLGAPNAVQWIGCLLLGLSPLLTMHALSGLETSLFAFFISGAWVLAAADSKPNSRLAAFLLGLLLLMGGLCRPEGIAFAGLMLMGLGWKRMRGDSRPRSKSKAIEAALAFAALIGYWLWRWWYYGNPLPNSYHAKAYDGILNPDSFWAMAKFAGYYVAIPAAGAILISLKQKRPIFSSVIANDPTKLVSILFLVIVMVTYLDSNLWMNYGSRFFFPFLPIVLLLLASAISWNSTPKISGWMKAVLIVLGIGQLGIMGFRQIQERVFLRYYDRIVQEELIPVGKVLKNSSPPIHRVASYMDAGALGFYSDATVIDFGRLSDTYLAQSKPSTQEVVEYFYSQSPEALVITSWIEDGIEYTDEAMAIVRDPRFKAYQFIRTWGNSAGFAYWQRLYLKQ